jgi:hypothetical protein
MSTTQDDLEQVERAAAEHLAAEEGKVEADLEAAAASQGGDDVVDAEPPGLRLRLAIATSFPTMAAAITVGSIFLGSRAYFVGAIAGLFGVGLAWMASNTRRPSTAIAVTIAGLMAIGLLMVVPTGLGNVTSVARLARVAAARGDVLRPPVQFIVGWQAIVGWLLGIIGFAAAWTAIVVKKPAIALLIPLPVAGIGAISVPKGDTQIFIGIAVLVLFAIGLGVLSTANNLGDEGERPSASYELRRALRALPLIAGITVGLYLLAQTNILFPKPLIDPTQEPQKPKTVPLSEVVDRVLFEVQSPVSGPWRVGSLDVYDGKTWRLPPFAQNKVKDVPSNGRVNLDLRPGLRAHFSIAGLGGAVLPALPNPVGILAEGPKLAYDSRNGNIRLSEGQIEPGLEYTVTAAAVPNVDDLRAINKPVPKAIQEFTETHADPPPAVDDLLTQCAAANKWDLFNCLRNHVLDDVTAAGTGQPVDVPPAKVQDMLAGSKQGSPFEIVAAQALLARWAGIPSRIGYGFDGGEVVNDRLQIRPRHGASFVEVYFPGYEWLPVIGTPKKARPTVANRPGQQQFDPNIVPSNDIAVNLFLPVLTKPKSVFAKQLGLILAIVLPLFLLLFLLYVTAPALIKAVIRSRRRNSALAQGPRARIALAYAEWRDTATDYGYVYVTDTPLMFLDRVAEDAEHNELAWLVTRCLWGDLQDEVGDDLAAVTEELSRTLRRRLGQAHPVTIRLIARLSRNSLRNPYAPSLNDMLGKETRREPVPA